MRPFVPDKKIPKNNLVAAGLVGVLADPLLRARCGYSNPTYKKPVRASIFIFKHLCSRLISQNIDFDDRKRSNLPKKNQE
jgi:hypothetical protein